jgi:DNA polymerase III delta prime subunit
MHLIFKNLRGNDRVKENLLSLLKSQDIPQALLFEGPANSQKKEFAHLFVEALLGRKNHPDMHVLAPLGKTGQHSMESIRECIKKAKESPFEGKYSYFIVDRADRLSIYSANALLKLLEESLKTTRFILIAEKKEDLIKTIQSRCISLRFSSVEWIFKEKSKAQNYLLDRLSQGAFPSFEKVQECSDTLDKYMAKEAEEEIKKYTKELTDSFGKEITALQKEEMQQKSEGFSALLMKNKVGELLNTVLDFVRDLHLLEQKADPKYLAFPEKEKQLKEVLKINGCYPLEKVLDSIEEATLMQERSTAFPRFFTPFLLNFPGISH